MKLLFTHSYFYKLDPKQWRFKQPYPPLGTLLAMSVAREQNFEVSFFDTNLRKSPREIEPVLQQLKPQCLIIYDDGFNYLTKMCLTVMRQAAFDLISEGKKNNCTVIVASSDSTDHYEKYLHQGADVIIRGEGEETLQDLLHALKNNMDLESVRGIAFAKNDVVITTAVRPVMRDLDALPLPAWDLVDMDSYRRVWKKYHGYFSLNIATTRGCPFKCNWCAKPIYGNRYNSRSPERVVAEISFLLQHHQPDHFWMCDDIFGLKPDWINHFRDLVVTQRLKFKYKIQSRVDLLVEQGTVEALAQSGAETVWVGAESGSQKILDAMDKGTTTGQIHDATRLLRKQGVRVAFFLQFGYLGESEEDIQATLRMVLDLMPDEIGISISYPLPKTKFYEIVKAQLKEKRNWSDSDDLAMMFQGTYSTRYYKVLHRYVHNRFRTKKGVSLLKAWTRKPWHLPLKSLISIAYHVPLSLVNHLRLKRLQKIYE